MCFIYDKIGPEIYLGNKCHRGALCKFNHVSYEHSTSFFRVSWWHYVLPTFYIFIPECTASHHSGRRCDNPRFCNSFHLGSFRRKRPRMFRQLNYKDDLNQHKCLSL